jgi:hypothetical protein
MPRKAVNKKGREKGMVGMSEKMGVITYKNQGKSNRETARLTQANKLHHIFTFRIEVFQKTFNQTSR